MLKLLIGPDWTANSDAVFKMISQDVARQQSGRILIVPELISHDTERRLCAHAGDTVSRYAEVLTFTRLAKRVSDAAGFGAPECLDNGGRLVAIASATRQLHSQLKAYAAVETRPEFLTGLLDAIDEFKRCCITAADLQHASQKTEGSLAQKLEELSLILEAYDSLCARGKRDPRDQMTWLLEQLEDSTFAEEHIFYIDGFPDFTRQHTAILKHLIGQSKQVVVSLNCDDVDSADPAFEKAAATAGELLRLAREVGAEVEICRITPAQLPVREILPALFEGEIVHNVELDNLATLYRCDSVYQECITAAERVISLIHAGCRYRDISIVCTDLAAYGNTLDMIFARYHIPVYRSGTENILDKTVITTVLSAIDAAVNGFEYSDVMRYLKSSLSPVDISTCDRLENYAIVWNITGNRWAEQWENHPRGLGESWTDSDRSRLDYLNRARSIALDPLFRLKKALQDATTLGQMVEALYTLLEELALDRKLRTFADEMERSGDLRTAQILMQLWEILLSALEQLQDMLGQTHWDARSFTKLLKLLLSQYDVGTIPAVLDAVMVGSVSAMRCQKPKHLMILGASEGRFPAYSGAAGILTDQERTALRLLGMPLTGGAIEGLQAEFAEIYGVFCGARETVCASCSDGQPSYLYRRLCEMAGGETPLPTACIAADPQEIAGMLVRHSANDAADSLGVREAFDNIFLKKNHSLGRMSNETVRALYGDTLNLSASQVDKQADCRLAYFLRYGLRLKEKKPASVDPAEFGTYVHAVLEDTGKKVMELGGFHKVSLEQTLEIANEYSRAYIAERFSQIDSQRVSYLFNRNVRELELVVTELWDELRESAFEPADFELAFGGENAIDIQGQTMSAKLRGFVDRVDIWNNGDEVFFRVVDYKTGKKDFDYCDIYNGLGLQMLLYLFALEENGGEHLGENPVPAGVQYFPARVPVVSVGNISDERAIAQEREKLWKRKGLLLANEAVLTAMEPAEKPKRLSYSKKDGSLSGEVADRRQLQLLRGYVFALLGKMVDDISSGCIEPNPYTRGSRHNACAFCPYSAICSESAEKGRRDFATMNAKSFWDEIEKEMRDHG